LWKLSHYIPAQLPFFGLLVVIGRDKLPASSEPWALFSNRIAGNSDYQFVHRIIHQKAASAITDVIIAAQKYSRIAHHPQLDVFAHPAAAKVRPIIAAHRLIVDRRRTVAVFTQVPDTTPLLIVGANNIVPA
jgi:hypothetical protein